MQFLRTAFWVALAIIIVMFSVSNWTPVTVNLWDGLRMDTKLPVLVIGAFIAGFVPLWLFHRAMCWRLRRRLETVERALSDHLATSTGLDMTGAAGPSGVVATSPSAA
ncbi:MAG: LapA family protein [Alphaproteobacteria bacterium]|nr:LapA family protein [Alphaproteobacteria bacterium]